MVDNKPWFLEFKRSCKRDYDGCALAFKKEWWDLKLWGSYYRIKGKYFDD